MNTQEIANFAVEQPMTSVLMTPPSINGRPTAKHVLSLLDLGADELARLVDRSVAYAKGELDGHKPLDEKIVGIYFRRPSTRTRTSFTVGALKLGAQTVAFGPNDLQIVTGETIGDTARVLSGYLDALVIRTNDSMDEMRALADQTHMSVINAMSENEHPTQAIADLSTMKECFGRLDDLHVLYLGEGNNSTAALAFAVAQTPGMRLTIVTPETYALPQEVVDQAKQVAEQHGSVIEAHSSMDDLTPVDVVYTTRWQTMGVAHPNPNWRDHFWPYSVTADLMANVSKPSGTIFMHDLPAVRGEDVHDDVLDGQQSWAWRQACHKMFSAMAVLEWCLDGREL